MAKVSNKNNVKIWRDCKVDIFYYEGDADIEKCEVRFEGNKIVVSYKDEGGYTTYSGESQGEGHFELTAPSVRGMATLHMFSKGRILEGYWREGGDGGMWRIFLTDN